MTVQRPIASLDVLPIAVRVFTTRERRRDPLEVVLARRPVRRKDPLEVMVFDTETTIDPSQRLLVGSWRLFRDPWDGKPGETCIEEGLFYPDDLPERDPTTFRTLEAFVQDTEASLAPGFSRMRHGRRLRVVPLSWWLDHRLYTYAYRHRDRCELVGFNVLFDLGRLAVDWGKARGYYRGGFSLRLWVRTFKEGWRDRRFHPRLLVKAIDPRRTLFAWGSLKKGDEDYKGGDARIVDLRTLSFALRDESLSLEGACEAFDVPYAKREVTYGVIDEPMLSYLREDVAATAALYRACKAELSRHEGIDLPAHRLYSPATVGTAYLEAMGLERPMEKFADLDPRIHGWAMSAFFGGRAEARIVRTEVPVSYVDATSMYPTVNALLGTWRILTAESVKVTEATEHVRRLLEAEALLDRCLKRDTWATDIGVTLVEIEDPVDQVLPTRAYWDPDARDPGIGLNPLTFDGRLWYMLPDVVASVLLSGRVPKIVRALRLSGTGTQPGLRLVRLRGHAVLDPSRPRVDPFVAMVEERRRLREDESLSDAEQARLDRFLKITANATSYGILARFDRRDLTRRVRVTVYGPDAEPTTSMTLHPEDPGPFAFPPIAASLTAGARLMLALLERLVSDWGGAYAFCDTDSMGIVAQQKRGRVNCPSARGHEIASLSWNQVRRLLDRFDDLNPYDRQAVPSLWKAELESLDRPLSCFAISAKRYALIREGSVVSLVDAHDETSEGIEQLGSSVGTVELLDRSEHGLGLYLDPMSPEEPRTDSRGRRIWISTAWEWILGRRRDLPRWAESLALTRFTVSTSRVADWFRSYNDSLPRERWVRPGSFGLLAHPSPEFRALSGGALPAAPYDRDPRRWGSLDWYDRRTGLPASVSKSSLAADADELADALATRVVVDTIATVVRRYRLRPEHKSLAPDGKRSDGRTVGLLRRRPILSAEVLTDLVGKEGNRLIERLTGELTEPHEYRTEYGARRDRFSALIAPVLRRIGVSEVAQRARVSRSAVGRSLRLVHPTRPHGSTLANYIRAAAEWVRASRPAISNQPSDLGALYAYLRDG